MLSRPPGDLTEFCRAVHPRLVGSLSLYTGDRDVAEELSQECLVRVCRDWPKLGTVANREAWAMRVAFNLANSFYRRRQAERRAQERLREGTGVPESHDPDWAKGIALRNALKSLPPRHRTVLIMRFYGDMSFADIADTLGTGESTVKSLARRGLHRLRQDATLDGLEEVHVG